VQRLLNTWLLSMLMTLPQVSGQLPQPQANPRGFSFWRYWLNATGKTSPP